MSERVHAPIPFIGGFESTYQPVHDRDVIETTEHDRRWRADSPCSRRAASASSVTRSAGIASRRKRACFDWAHTDDVLGELHDLGIDVIVDLFHHTSYPAWLGRFADPAFPAAFLRFVERFAARYPWVASYTVCNEPFTTLLLCGQFGVWPPHGRGLRSFVRLASTVVPAVERRQPRPHRPAARGRTRARGGLRAPQLGRRGRRAHGGPRQRPPVPDARPAGRATDRPGAAVRRAGGPPPAATSSSPLEPGHVDVLGLDYYAHNQWHWFGARARHHHRPGAAAARRPHPGVRRPLRASRLP